MVFIMAVGFSEASTRNMAILTMRVSKCAYSPVICPSPTLASIISITFVIQVRLEILINHLSVFMAAARLPPIVAIAKVMSLAARKEVISVRIVLGMRTSIV